MQDTRRRDTGAALGRLAAAAAAAGRPLTFMEVCGTHTMAALRSGLHGLLPEGVRLLSGPGCPVCVTAQGDIDQLIELAGRNGLTLCTYGDMLRVPGSLGSLEAARGQGADVRTVYSALEAVKLAAAQPRQEVVFAAVGFETTAPATAVAIQEARRRGLGNFSALASHKQVVPAMRALLEGGRHRLDGFLCPGHVSVIIGAEAYRPVVEEHGVPCVVAGFEAGQMASGLALLAEQAARGEALLVNDYPEAVTGEGNLVARRLLAEVFAPADARWRGLGVIPGSGLELRPDFAAFDARRRFGLSRPEDREPPGCLCGTVLAGLVTPEDCTLYGTACTPVHPVGPCMVSPEGTCHAWFRHQGVGPAAKEGRTAPGGLSGSGPAAPLREPAGETVRRPAGKE